MIKQVGANELSSIAKNALFDILWLNREYVINKRSKEDIARELGVHPWTVNKYLILNNFDIRSPDPICVDIKKKLLNKDWLISEYVNKNKSSNELSKELTVSGSTIMRYLKRHKIQIKKTATSLAALEKLNDRKWLYNQYIILGKPAHDISKKIGTNPGIVGRYLKKYKIKTRTPGRLSKKSSKKLKNKKWLVDEYEHKSALQISKEINSTPATILKYLRKYNIRIDKSYNRSIVEDEIKDFIIRLGYDPIIGNRTILSGKEIDIFLPNENFGIEVNGIYWHSINPFYGRANRRISKNKHSLKTSLAREKGVCLIHLTDYEWKHKKEQCQSIILNQLGLNKLISSEGSIIQETSDHMEIESFFSKNYLKDIIFGQRNILLKKNNEILLALTIAENNHIRFCELNNCQIGGGLEKILKYLKCSEAIFEFDNSIINRQKLKNLGFVHKYNISPGFTWFDLKSGPISKDEIVNISEDQLFNSGFCKYFDCGRAIFMLNIAQD